MTVVIVTHSLREAVYLAQRVVAGWLRGPARRGHAYRFRCAHRLDANRSCLQRRGPARPASASSGRWWMTFLVHRFIPPFLVAVLFLLLWEGIVVVFEIEPFLLPSPVAVWEAAIEHWHQLLQAALRTGGAALAGFVLAGTVGVALGASSGSPAGWSGLLPTDPAAADGSPDRDRAAVRDLVRIRGSIDDRGDRGGGDLPGHREHSRRDPSTRPAVARAVPLPPRLPVADLVEAAASLRLAFDHHRTSRRGGAVRHRCDHRGIRQRGTPVIRRRSVR